MIVPTTFIGGRRYHVGNYQDAMTICRMYGPPKIFVTFTCNTKWREIKDALRFEPGQQPCDRTDMIVRGFNMKIDEFTTDIREGTTFGHVLAVLYTVEFWKSDLPHIHCLVWLAASSSEFSASTVDDFICVDIPDVSIDPLDYALVDTSNSMQQTPQRGFRCALALPLATSEASHASRTTSSKAPLLIPRTLATPESVKDATENKSAPHKAVDIPDNAATSTQKSVSKKRAHASTSKGVVKKLFADDDIMDDNGHRSADSVAAAAAAQPSVAKDN